MEGDLLMQTDPELLPSYLIRPTFYFSHVELIMSTYTFSSVYMNQKILVLIVIYISSHI